MQAVGAGEGDVEEVARLGLEQVDQHTGASGVVGEELLAERVQILVPEAEVDVDQVVALLQERDQPGGCTERSSVGETKPEIRIPPSFGWAG